jgi:hypothetical protein
MKKQHKLYCYIDETGQDTKGDLFIVAIIVTDDRRHELEECLRVLELASGKQRRKWLKTRDRERQLYINALVSQLLPCAIFTKCYLRTAGAVGGYDELEVLATAQALNMYCQQNAISSNGYKVTITIDGLSKTVAVRMGSEFRKLGISTRKVIGRKDESTAIIRLADAVAGLMREAREGRKEYKVLRASLKRSDKLHEL